LETLEEAIRAAVGKGGVAVIVIPGDVTKRLHVPARALKTSSGQPRIHGHHDRDRVTENPMRSLLHLGHSRGDLEQFHYRARLVSMTKAMR
jgi:hypothetical protein